MEAQRTIMADTRTTCPICGSQYRTVSAKNEHLKKVHNQQVLDNRNVHIICPLCRENKLACGTFKKLEDHLAVSHSIKLELLTFNFSSKEACEHWLVEQKIETMYTMSRTRKNNDHEQKDFMCNRSNLKGHESKCAKRTEKAGGSIKMYGVCPSRLIVRFFDTGQCAVQFWLTHVGHEEEIRSQHLSSVEKTLVVEKLVSGVSVERIISDARQVRSNKLERINMLTRKDVAYLTKKHNVNKRRHENTMIAVVMKVNEWNANGKRYCFFFKQQGENHPILRTEDFCLGFMNENMEKKLKDYSRIICMDGTHCTNQSGMDLTIMLVKDDKNMGFPVAFFLSNRLDQVVQEIFLGALREKIGGVIQPECFMTDDDPKYHNAWVKEMGTIPRRLLCSWHVLKNWIIQGRAKIKNEELKKSLKADMKKIMNETKVEKFVEISEEYFERLQNANEIQFLNYLQKYYYQSEERTAMWAHCHRINAGVNTNISLESLNNLLKTNQLKRRTNVTIDRLLDEIENLVTAKMWQRILNVERPHSDTYQDKVIIRAHKEAEKMDKTSIRETGFGEFQVKSSKGESYYNISYNELCELECKTLYCRVCKVCIHRYKCDCPQYAVKTTICKHIHLVCLYEQGKGSDSVLDDVANMLADGRSSSIRDNHNEEMDQFIEERKNQIQGPPPVDECMEREMVIEALSNYLRNLDHDTFHRKKQIFGPWLMEPTNKSTTLKRKMEKQAFFPAKKRK